MLTTSDLAEFKCEAFGELDVLVINGKPYFPATRCAEALGYTNPWKAVSDHCPHLTKREVGVETGKKADGTVAFQIVERNFIPEGDLYRLIVRSNLPTAEKFERWVFDEVLPSIRQTGGYITPEREAAALAERIKLEAKAAVAEQLKRDVGMITVTELNRMIENAAVTAARVIGEYERARGRK